MESLIEVGLDTYRLVRERPEIQEEAALAWLRRIKPEAWDLIRTQTRELIWVEPLDWSSPDIFASTTFFDHLGITYLTPLALRYVPPSTMSKSPHPYFLAENLYHEATHQELYRLIEDGRILCPDGRGNAGPLIEICWRRTQWSLEHAFHALIVYSRVLELRRAAVQSNESSLGPSAIKDAQAAISDLRDGIMPHIGLFHEAGKKFLQYA